MLLILGDVVRIVPLKANSKSESLDNLKIITTVFTKFSQKQVA